MTQVSVLGKEVVPGAEMVVGPPLQQEHPEQGLRRGEREGEMAGLAVCILCQNGKLKQAVGTVYVVSLRLYFWIHSLENTAMHS